MRSLASLLVVLLPGFAGCSKPKPAAREADPMALAARCPLGDNTSVDIYGFLARELEASAGDRGTTKHQLAYEATLLADKRIMKPQRASVVEGETSHVLTTLCAGTPGCKAVGLYDHGGFAIALSAIGDVVMPLGFADDARWATLVKQPPGGVPLAMTSAERAEAKTTGVLVVVPVEGALGACIVDDAK